MEDRYVVGNTDQTRHVVRDDKQGALIALCTQPSHARQIVDALNAVDALPSRFMVTGPDALDQVPIPVDIRRWTFEHLNLNNVHVTTLGTVQWLDQLFQFLRQAGRDEWAAEAVPVPPWRER